MKGQCKERHEENGAEGKRRERPDQVATIRIPREGKWQLKKVSESVDSQRNYIDNKLCYAPVQRHVQRQC